MPCCLITYGLDVQHKLITISSGRGNINTYNNRGLLAVVGRRNWLGLMDFMLGEELFHVIKLRLENHHRGTNISEWSTLRGVVMVVWVRLVGGGGGYVSCGENCRPGLYFCNQTSVFLYNSASISFIWNRMAPLVKSEKGEKRSNACDLYSKDVRFESRLGHLLYLCRSLKAKTVELLEMGGHI